MKRMKFTKAIQFIFIGTIILTFLSFNKVTNSFFDKKVSIQYTGQVKGLPAKDIITYSYEPIDENKGTVNCIMSRKDYNPYNLTQSYTAQSTEESVEIDLYSILHPMNLSRSPEIEITSKGDMFDIPKILVVGQKLADKDGLAELKYGESVSKTLKINVTDRQVVAKEIITVGGKSYNTYKMTYKISTDKYFNNELFENDLEQIEEWVAPNLGFLKRTSNRTVTQYQMEKAVKSYTSEFSIEATQISL
jgi:hypothetical protein